MTMTEQVVDLSDEELEKYIQEVHGRTVPWVCEASATAELLRRYKNKKAALTATETLLGQKGKECEELKMEISHGMPWR